MTLPSLSLYIHFPWCIRKCPYCDFNSHELDKELPNQEADYIAALVKDLQYSQHLTAWRPIQSIFMGGGTPSLISAYGINHLLTQLKEYVNISADCEITMEANPGTFEQKRFAGYLEAGVNRLSIGVQSFDNEKLTKLGRIHDSDNAKSAICQAKQVGFDNINLDLMFGLPNQSIDQALKDLRMAISFEPQHISWYQLTLEPNTVFHSKPPSLPKDDQTWQMAQQGLALLQQHGYKQYEVSAYSKDDQQCRHNLNYWTFGDYLGIGAGAHSKMTAKNGDIIRFHKFKQPSSYLIANNDYIAKQSILSAEDLRFEFMLNHLRLYQEINLQDFTEKTGQPIELLESGLEQALQQQLITRNDNIINITDNGKRFLNDLQGLFL